MRPPDFTQNLPLPFRLLLAAYRKGGILHASWRAHRTLPHPGGTILSLGGLSFGGVGKTPLAADLARDLRTRGRRVALVSRPYGASRPTQEVLQVSLNTPPELVGDEALVLVHLAPEIPVFCSPDRYKALLQARETGAEILVLDDGFLDRTLPRDLDIVILHPRHPRANLRSSPRLLNSPYRILSLEHPPPWWNGKMDGSFTFQPLGFRDSMDRVRPMPGPAFTFSGLGDPDRFLADVGTVAAVVGSERFPDHHGYSLRDVETLARKAERSGASCLVTSLKDMVKIAPLLPPEPPLPFLWLTNRIQSDFSWKELIRYDVGI